MCWYCLNLDFGSCDNKKIGVDCQNICCNKCGFIIGGEKEDNEIELGNEELFNKLKVLYKNHNCNHINKTIFDTTLIEEIFGEMKSNCNNDDINMCIDCYDKKKYL